MLLKQSETQYVNIAISDDPNKIWDLLAQRGYIAKKKSGTSAIGIFSPQDLVDFPAGTYKLHPSLSVDLFQNLLANAAPRDPATTF